MAASLSTGLSPPPTLKFIDPASHTFVTPIKQIHSLPDVHRFISSPAYELITSFILHLNASVSPLDYETSTLRNPADYTLTSPNIPVSPEVQNVIDLIHTLEGFIDQAPPDPGPRRFGNVACRKWHALVNEALSKADGGLLDKYLPAKITSLGKPKGRISAKGELLPYLLGSFGSAQRLDYGTGHELSFAAFLGGIWVLGGFQPGRDEVALVLKCFDAYFRLTRKLVLTYTLEPAGSHGVWGLDDHSFLPYIFGSAQLTTYPPTSDATAMNPPVQQGVERLEDVPKPGDVVKSSVVERERFKNLYFGAVGFIYDVKTGPFWEHSPTLYDISGVQGGWGKINKGMLKMYNAEVLGKFPVVQHFPFGSIFNWGTPDLDTPTKQLNSSNVQISSSRSHVVGDSPASTAPWVNKTSLPETTTRVPWAKGSSQPLSNNISGTTVRAPWAKSLSHSFSDLRNPFLLGTERAMGSKPGEQPITAQAPQASMCSASAGMDSACPPLAGQSNEEDAKVSWATSRGEIDTPPHIQQATEANLGPKRTSSPDSMLAVSLDGEEAEKRRGSLGTGGVRVAETGDLKRKQSSVGS